MCKCLALVMLPGRKRLFVRYLVLMKSNIIAKGNVPNVWKFIYRCYTRCIRVLYNSTWIRTPTASTWNTTFKYWYLLTTVTVYDFYAALTEQGSRDSHPGGSGWPRRWVRSSSISETLPWKWNWTTNSKLDSPSQTPENHTLIYSLKRLYYYIICTPKVQCIIVGFTKYQSNCLDVSEYTCWFCFKICPFIALNTTFWLVMKVF